MTDEQSAYFATPEVTNFQVLLEEVTRAKPGAPDARFVEPDAETFERLKSRFHHVLFGRRGTGKSSLLRKMESHLLDEERLVAWTDQETFSALSYPDVLVATLAEVFRQFARQLKIRDAAAEKPKSGLFRKKLPPSNELRLAEALDAVVTQLNELKNAPSASEIAWTANYTNTNSSQAEGSVEVKGSGEGVSAGLLGKFGKSSERQHGGSVAHQYRADKREHLERAVTTYRDLMLECSGLVPDAYIVLDDFYRLPEEVQPEIAGYFHRVVKDTNVWLKFGSIPFWSRLYRGSPATGLQVPHDLRELSLDRGLSDFGNSKRFLEAILGKLAEEKGVKIPELFTDGALDRLVLAAGAVPRDYIGLASDSIAIAKGRGESAKSGTRRVGAEDVNSAASRTATSKLDDLNEDAGERSEELRRLVIKVTAHCRQTKRAWFLVDALDTALVRRMGRLQNMRFVHLIDSNESLPKLGSSRYLVYILDVSQLAAQRATRVDFMGWRERQARRVKVLIFQEESVTPEMIAEAQAEQAEAVNLTLFDAADDDAIVGTVDAPVSTDQSGAMRSA